MNIKIRVIQITATCNPESCLFARDKLSVSFGVNNNKEAGGIKDDMDAKVPLRDDAAFKKLKEYYDKAGKDINILKLFKEDADRARKFK